MADGRDVGRDRVILDALHAVLEDDDGLDAVDVAALIAGREGRLCARIFRRANGTVITVDCSAVRGRGVDREATVSA